MIFTVVVPRRPEQQVPARLRCAGQEGEMLRQHQDHEERPRFAILRRESQIPGRRDGGRGRRGVPGVIIGSCELSAPYRFIDSFPAQKKNTGIS